MPHSFLVGTISLYELCAVRQIYIFFSIFVVDELITIKNKIAPQFFIILSTPRMLSHNTIDIVLSCINIFFFNSYLLGMKKSSYLRISFTKILHNSPSSSICILVTFNLMAPSSVCVSVYTKYIYVRTTLRILWD